MGQYPPDEKARLWRQLTRQAIALAMENHWEEAQSVNLSILEILPNDVDALNRLGKSFTELGQYDEAREAYQQALGIDPNNTIAKKNLTRLAHLKGGAPLAREEQTKAGPNLFIEEMGKTQVTALVNLAPREALAKMAAGDQVHLVPRNRDLVVQNSRGEDLGQVEPRLSLRVLKLMAAGNRYSAAITSLNDEGCKVIIREVYQHPSQAGRPSFPQKGADGFRPYVKEGLVRADMEEEEEAVEEEVYATGWEEEREGVPEGITVVSEDEALAEEEAQAKEEEE